MFSGIPFTPIQFRSNLHRDTSGALDWFKHHERSKSLTQTKLVRDCVGATIVEFTLVFPIFILVALGTVDVGFMLSDWAAGKHSGLCRCTQGDSFGSSCSKDLNNFFNDTITGGMGLPCADC